MKIGRPAATVPAAPPQTTEKEIPQVADRSALVLSAAEPLRLSTRVAGLFLFLPLLARLGFDKLVRKQIRYLDESVSLRDYEGPVRQIALTGLGREQPTLFLTNNFEASPRDMISHYARRNGIEDGLGTNVNFFHLDCLCSEVRLNVDLDVTLTVIAHGCYRWLARQLKGFDQAKPKQLCRKFVETGGVIEVGTNRRLLITFDRRRHNPILREAALDRHCSAIPWLKKYRIEFNYL